MNYVDLFLGIGLGILLTVLTITIFHSIAEKSEKEEKQKAELKDYIKLHRNLIRELSGRIEKLEQFKKDSELSLPIIADRLYTLESRRK